MNRRSFIAWLGLAPVAIVAPQAVEAEEIGASETGAGADRAAVARLEAMWAELKAELPGKIMQMIADARRRNVSI